MWKKNNLERISTTCFEKRLYTGTYNVMLHGTFISWYQNVSFWDQGLKLIGLNFIGRFLNNQVYYITSKDRIE